jgi:Malectin domain
MATRSVRPQASVEEVKRELEAIFRSPVFAHSARQTKLLEYLCNKVLLGETAHIKATTIAIEVFGRQWDFDESKDAIVRVEAHRLRRKLGKYYEGEGAKSHLRVVLPPGRYVPEFIVDEGQGSLETPTADPPTDDPSIPRNESPRAKQTAVHPRLLLALVLGGFVLAGIAGSVFVLRGAHTKEAGPIATRPHISTAAAIPPGPEIRILAGRSNANYMDRFGRQWGPDRYFTGGAVEPGPKDFYGRPPDAGLFATMRTGEFSYDVPVAPGEYELRLYWAEPIFRLANESNGGGENERRFNVIINGKQALAAFDVVADSGTSPVDVRSFRAITPDRDGLVHIRFTASYGTPFLNGLELLPATPGRTVPVRIRAHDLSFTDHEGNVWSPDNYYIGGRLATHKQAVTGTPDPDLYGGERYGHFSYAIPVPPGKYTVTLYFAETWFRPDSDGQDHGGAGDRIFDVYCNGTTLLKDLDVFAKAGPFRAMTRAYHGIRPNGQGKILLTFSPTKNYAAVKAIQIVDEP